MLQYTIDCFFVIWIIESIDISDENINYNSCYNRQYSRMIIDGFFLANTFYQTRTYLDYVEG